MTYVFLAVAIIAEIVATTMLKATEGFSRLIPSIIVIVMYAVAFYCLSLVLRAMPVGVAYAIWCGLGVFLVSVVCAYVYKQIPDTPAMIGMGLIILGVVVINIFSKTVTH